MLRLQMLNLKTSVCLRICLFVVGFKGNLSLLDIFSYGFRRKADARPTWVDATGLGGLATLAV